MISRRGVFGALAALGLTKVMPVEAAPGAKFPQEGVELASMRWFLKNRGRGFMRGLESGHNIFVTRDVLKGVDENKLLSLR